MNEFTNMTLLETLEHIESLITDFHAVRDIRAWAADENKATKLAALQAIHVAMIKAKALEP